jgi:hypothetical protein
MIAELQFLLADRADIDAYRTQPFVNLMISGRGFGVRMGTKWSVINAAAKIV